MKGGYIFKELIYVNNKYYCYKQAGENVNSSIYIKLFKSKEVIKTNPQSENNSSVKEGKDAKNSVANKQKTSLSNVNSQAQLQVIEEVELLEKIKLNIVISKEDKELFRSENINVAFIENFTFEGSFIVETKDDKKVKKDPKKKDAKDEQPTQQIHPYSITCQIDPDELKLLNPDTNYMWSIKVFPTDTLAFLKDTLKEDFYLELKSNWEAEDIGRAARAQRARNTYLAKLKKDQGHSLSSDEANLLKDERQRKVKKPEEDNSSSVSKDKDKKTDLKGKKQPVADSTLFAATTISQPFSNKYYIDLNKEPLPKPDQHNSAFIKNFLSYCYKNKVCEERSKSEELVNKQKDGVNQELLKSKKEEIEEKHKQSELELQKRKEQSTKLKENFPNAVKIINKKRNEVRTKEFKDKREDLNKQREILRLQLKGVKDNEKKLKEAISMCEIDITYAVNNYLDVLNSGFKSELIEKAREVRNNK